MDAYRELHEHESNPIKVGVDLTSVASAALAISDPEAARSSVGSDKYEQQVAILPSFKVYWDDEDGEYKINDPKVVGPDGEIAVTAADKITTGTWYCKIYKDNGTWKAAIVDDNTADENEPTYVPICTIVSANDIVQHHIGTIVFSASGVTSMTGDGSLSQGQPSAKVDGDVEVTGKLDPTNDDTSCGIEFVTVPKREAQGGAPAIPARMIARIKGRVADEKGWSAHTMTIKGEKGSSDTEIHFLGSADCTIPRPSAPTIPDIEIDTTAITSGKAVGGLSVAATNKHKIIASAVDIPDISGKADKAIGLTGATKCKITYNDHGIVTAGADLEASDLPTHTHTKEDITDFPTLATVATSGDYEDLTNKPTIPTIPDITATPSGTGNVVTDVTADGHALTVTKGTVKEPSGSDYIDVSSTGAVSAKVPTDGSKGLVTTDTVQTVSAMKTFSAGIVCGTSGGRRSHYMPSNVEFYPAAGAGNGGFIDFHMDGDTSDHTSRIIEDKYGLHLLGSTSKGILLNGNAANKVRMNHHPTVGVSEADAALRKAVPTCGWVNDNYKVTEIVPDGNNAGISITPDTTNPKILKLKNTGMSERSLFLNGTAASNKFFGTGDINLTIAQKTLVQGEGIVLTPSGNDIVISATSAGGTTGFSGKRNVLADVSYDIESHCLRKRFYYETWENGVLKLSVLGQWKDYHQAVPETV